MKTIDVNGRKLEYEIFYDVCEYGEAYQTVFYEGTISKNRKKWFLFGPEISISKPKELFKLYFNIEDPNLTKSDIRFTLERKIELLNREKEIEEGEII